MQPEYVVNVDLGTFARCRTKNTRRLCFPVPSSPMFPPQRPYVSTSETYYKQNAINPPYHAPYHQAHFPFFFPTAFLTRFVLPTSFFTSSLASSIAIRSRRSSAISSCSVGSTHEPLHFPQKSITDNDSSSIRHTVCDNFETPDKTSAYILN